MLAGLLGRFYIKFWIIMLNRNKHPYKIEERFLSGKVVVMYVKYRFIYLLH